MSEKPPENLGVIARRLREARLEMGISQRQLGIAAGWDPASASPRFNQYERGKHTPDIGTLTRLARLLDRPVPYFYTDDDGLAAVILAYHRASAAQRTQWKAMASVSTTKEKTASR